MKTIPLYVSELKIALCYDLFIFPPLVPDSYVIFSYDRIINFQRDKNILKEIQMNSTESSTTLLETTFRVFKEKNIYFRIEKKDDPNERLLPKPVKWKKVFKRNMKKIPLWCLNINTGWTSALPFTNILYRKRESSDYLYIKRLVEDTLKVTSYIFRYDKSLV